MQLNTDISSVNNQNIGSDSRIQSSQSAQSAEKIISNQNNISDKIYGEVKNLTRSQITLVTAEGENITAKILNPELLKIGMSGEFKITQTNSGMTLSLISSSRQTMQENILNDTLASLGLKINKENKDILKMLLDNSFPVTKENFQKLNQALKVVGNDKPQEALFFLNNNIKPSFKAAENLNSYINQEIKISNQISQLTDSILNNNDTNFLQKALSVISQNNIPAEIVKSTENLNILKSNILDLINQLNPDSLKSDSLNTNDNSLDNSLNFINKSNENQAVISNLDSTQNSDIKSVSYENTELKADNFIQQNAKEVLKLFESVITSENIEKLPQIFKDNFNIPKSFENLNTKDLLNEIFKVFPELKNPVSNFLKTKENVKEFLTKSLSINPRNTKDNNFEEHLNNVSEKLTLLKNEMSTPNTNETNLNIAQSLKFIDNINNNLNFFSSMQNTIFLQIPVIINNVPETAELYVFKDKNKKPKKAGQASALVALDTAFLGHFESYVQKNNQSISCQFRLENDYIKKIVSENINLLNDYLKNYNLNLESVSYKKIDEPFTVTDSEPVEESNVIKDFTFDMQT